METAISFEVTPPSLTEIEQRIFETLNKFPWLVLESHEGVLGYAYAGPYRNRSAYSWSAETAVYVRQGFQSKGIGKVLYSRLLELLETQGFFNVIGGIALPNDASVRLHESLGFKKVAHFKDIGFKLGQWWDIGFWQLQFPKPVKPQDLKAPWPIV
jgi:L-amino acid N-acyltransferase YncA